MALSLDGPPSAVHVGLFLARERGYFVDEGLEVYFQVATSRAAALAALLRGRDELALVGAADLLVARAAGAPLLSVMALDGRGDGAYELVLATTERVRTEQPVLLRAFAAALVRGYGEATRDPGAARDTLLRVDGDIDRVAAERLLADLSPHWRGPSPFGFQSGDRWRAAVQRLGADRGATTLDPFAAFTNEVAIAAAPTATPIPTMTSTPRPTATPIRPTPRPPPPTPTPTATSIQPPPIAPPPAEAAPAATASPPGAGTAPPAPAAPAPSPAGQLVPLPGAPTATAAPPPRSAP